MDSPHRESCDALALSRGLLIAGSLFLAVWLALVWLGTNWL